MINSNKQWGEFLSHVCTCFWPLLLNMSSCSSSLLNDLCLPPAPPSDFFFLTLKSFNWNSTMSERCNVSHYTSICHTVRFRNRCSAVPSVSSLHISSSIFLPELLNKSVFNKSMQALFAQRWLTVQYILLDLNTCVWELRLRWVVIYIYAPLSVFCRRMLAFW